MQLKFYLVLQGPDDELVIWKRPEYENYIKGAVGVGAGSAYKLITHFDPGESLINEYVTLPPLPVKSEETELGKCIQVMLLNSGLVDSYMCESGDLAEAANQISGAFKKMGFSDEFIQSLQHYSLTKR